MLWGKHDCEKTIQGTINQLQVNYLRGGFQISSENINDLRANVIPSQYCSPKCVNNIVHTLW